jgi:hypothetical protein
VSAGWAGERTRGVDCSLGQDGTGGDCLTIRRRGFDGDRYGESSTGDPSEVRGRCPTNTAFLFSYTTAGWREAEGGDDESGPGSAVDRGAMAIRGRVMTAESACGLDPPWRGPEVVGSVK